MNVIESYRGIPTGKINKRYLSRNDISQRAFAEKIGMQFQNLNAFLSGKRTIPLNITIRIDQELGFEEGTIAILQTYAQLAVIKNSAKQTKRIPVIRDTVFWDIDPAKLDWNKNKAFIIKRVNERGNAEEIKQVTEYYG